jgi:hypothetical protein
MAGISTRLRAKERNGLSSLFGGDGQNGIENQRRQYRVVLAAARAHRPGPLVLLIELLERCFDLLEHPRSGSGGHTLPPFIFK